jgi:hypothetical protein
MSEYFTRVANDVLKASEELSVVLEDGIAAMLNGGAKAESEPVAPDSAEFEGFEDIEEELRNSPLQGMAESVLSNLMANQVSFGCIGCLGGGPVIFSFLSSFANIVPPGSTGNIAGKTGCIPKCHYMVRTFHYGSFNLSRRHVCTLPSGDTTRCGIGASTWHHDFYCYFGTIGRISQCNSRTELARILHTKLF